MGFTKENTGEAHDAICEALTLATEAQRHTDRCWELPVHIGPDVHLAIAVNAAVSSLHRAKSIIELGGEDSGPTARDSKVAQAEAMARAKGWW